jgi:PfaD family protein
MGADFVLTGSVNQACVESGLHSDARNLLFSAGIADMARCPSADMFEIGAEVQVLRRGTLFPQRARRLQDIYKRHQGLQDLTPDERRFLEKDLFRTSVEEAWASTAEFWNRRRPEELRKAETDSRHQMALLFRTYLGLSSRWPMDGTMDRVTDYQIWTGPAQGSFNTWVKGQFLEQPKDRTVAEVALNLLEGACQANRAQQFRSAGIPVTPLSFAYRTRPLTQSRPRGT